MAQQGSSGGSSSRGFLTDTDKDWLSGQPVSSKADQKRRCQDRIAQAAADIETITTQGSEGPSNLSDVGELFDNSEAVAGQSSEDVAKNLIALAFMITNDSVDYETVAEGTEIHPRDPEHSPDDDDRPVGGGAAGASNPVDDILAFRRALRGGIKVGKDYFDDGVPHRVLIDSSTKLYKEPTPERVDSDEFDDGFTTEDWKDSKADRLDASAPHELNADELDRETALNRMVAEIEASIIHYQRLLRSDPDVEIRRHDNL